MPTAARGPFPAKTLRDIGEFGLIARIEGVLRSEGMASRATLGIGDDAAAFRARDGFEVLLTCDCLVEGRHYLPEHTNPFALGRRAMSVNLSDIGSMGGIPTLALVSLGLNPSTEVDAVLDMYRGFAAALNPFGATIAGGNLTRTRGPVFVDVTLLGEVEPERMLRRSTARPGDAILLTGYPGHAAAGLHLLRAPRPPTDIGARSLIQAYTAPEHRAREGREVALSGLASAMIDTSDGFAADLTRLCQSSGVGAELAAERLPLSAALLGAAKSLGTDALDLALGPSDDYQLIITCAPGRQARLLEVIRNVSSVNVTEVGRLTERTGVVELVWPDGGRRPVTPRGWDHFSTATNRAPRRGPS